MSAINPDHLHHFRFIGRVLGKALCDEQVGKCVHPSLSPSMPPSMRTAMCRGSLARFLPYSKSRSQTTTQPLGRPNSKPAAGRAPVPARVQAHPRRAHHAPRPRGAPFLSFLFCLLCAERGANVGGWLVDGFLDFVDHGYPPPPPNKSTPRRRSTRSTTSRSARFWSSRWRTWAWT